MAQAEIKPRSAALEADTLPPGPGGGEVREWWWRRWGLARISLTKQEP